MISTIVFLTGFLVSSTTAQMSISYFRDNIEQNCYNYTVDKSRLLVDGQEKPLAHTLENFISLVEKLELANPDLKLEDEVFLLLRHYTLENLVLESGGIVEWTPEGTNYQKYIENLWQPDSAKRDSVPSHINPFTAEEECSLYYMLSHTVNDTARRNVDDSILKSYVDISADGKMSTEMKKTRIPREQGVVAIGMSAHAVALSRVALGIYLGLNANRRRDIGEILGTEADKIPVEVSDRTVDSLYVLTLADMLVLTKWPFVKTRREFGGNGKWKSALNGQRPDFNIDEICPVVYELAENETSPYTFSSVRGGVDGLILGSIIEDVYRDSSNQLKFAQILRMYYSQRGVPEMSQLSTLSSASFCNRIDRIGEMTELLKNQIDLYIVLISKDNSKFLSVREDAWRNFETKRGEILTVNSELDGFCQDPPTVESSKELPCETATDVIVVMDSSNQDSLENQQLIIGHLANRLNLYHGGSTITVLMDQQNGTRDLDLKEVIPQTSSSACAACLVTQYTYADFSDSSDKEIVIQSLDKLLEDKKESEEKLNGVPGKIVIYFNYDSVAPSYSYRFDKVLKDLHIRHQDVPIYAVGRNQDVLKKFARKNIHDIVVTDTDPKDSAKVLSRKICEGPATLQYTNCKGGADEPNSVYEGIVTPNYIQHWALFPKYFYKSYNVKVFFEVTDGNIQVCHNRASTRPELEKKNCARTNSTARRLTFKHSNPCKGFSAYTCAPMYFSVIGIDETSNQGSIARTGRYCQKSRETSCRTLDQVQFKVTHEGVRCSGCAGLFATQFLLLISSVIAYFLFTKEH